MSSWFRMGLLGAAALAALCACSQEGSLSPAMAFSVNRIGSEGGVVQGGAITIEIPRGALSNPVDITANATFDVSLPEGVILVGPAFDLDPDSTQFSQPVAVNITFSSANLGASIPVLHHSTDSDIFSPVADSQFNASSMTVRGSITHFSFVAAFVTSIATGGAGSPSGGTGGMVTVAGGAPTTGGTSASGGVPNTAGTGGSGG